MDLGFRVRSLLNFLCPRWCADDRLVAEMRASCAQKLAKSPRMLDIGKSWHLALR